MYADIHATVAVLVIEDRIREAAAARASRDLPRPRRLRRPARLWRVRRPAVAG
jgi:hypothetical protein